MLTALTTLPALGDDVFHEDPATLSLEAHIASLTSHPAALLVTSGTMGNQISLRSLLTQPPHSVLCDHRAHILDAEAGGTAVLCGALIKGVVPANGVYLTLEDVKANVMLSDDVHTCPTRVISLENTISGAIVPLAEIRRIAAFARSNDIKLHLDGARLWEAVAAGAGRLNEFAREFDSVSMCFSKGLGAPVGSVIVGSESFVKHARWIRKSLGGGTRQCGIIAAPARVAVDEVFGHGPGGEGGKLRAVHDKAKRVRDYWVARGGKVALPVETNMVWLDLDAAGVERPEWGEWAREEGVRLLAGRIVLHHQITDEGIRRLQRVMDRALAHQQHKTLKGNTASDPSKEEKEKARTEDKGMDS